MQKFPTSNLQPPTSNYGFTQHYFLGQSSFWAMLGKYKKTSISIKTLKNSAGFTLIELLVVLAIMGVILGIFTVNIAGQRAARNTTIAQNELVTNLKGLQSYVLSSRNINNNQPVQYYVAKFDFATPGQYTLQAIYNVTSVPALQDLQTIKFPTGVTFSSISINGDAVTQGCALVAFRLPYGKIIMNDGCNRNPQTDDYQKIINFVVNISGSKTLSDYDMNINLNYNQGAPTRTVIVKGLTGTIIFQ